MTRTGRGASMGKLWQAVVLALSIVTSFLPFSRSSVAAGSGMTVVRDAPLPTLAGLLAEQQAALPNSVPQLSGLTVEAPPARDTATHAATITFLPRNYDALQQLVYQLNDPNSPEFRHFLTGDQYLQDYSPGQDTYDLALQYVSTRGLTVIAEASNRLVLEVGGSRAMLDSAFGTSSVYAQSPSGVTGFVNTTALHLPASLADLVSAVSGFDELHPLRSSPVVSPVNGASGIGTDLGVASFGVDDPEALRTAYHVPGGPEGSTTGLNGAGVKIGIVLDSLPLATDVASWNSNYASPSLSSPFVAPITYSQNGSDLSGGSDQVEADIDVTNAHVVAPEAGITFYLSASMYSSALSVALNNAITGGAQVVSMSFDGCAIGSAIASEYNAWHPVFVTAAAQGVAVVVSSGDAGIYMCNPLDEQGYITTAVAGEAATITDDSLVTSVGGTTIQMDLSHNYVGETAWSCKSTSDSTTCYHSTYGSSGGGLSAVDSTLQPQPAYQLGRIPIPDPVFDSSLARNYTTRRAVPDISTNADPITGLIYSVYHDSQGWWGWRSGGTSAAAPWLAGSLALAVQQYGGNIGGVNPILYQDCPNATWCPDITSGFTGVYAGTNWDYTTGLGSVKDVTGLAQAIASQVVTISVSPGWNLITLPVAPVTPLSADTALAELMGSSHGYAAMAGLSGSSWGASRYLDMADNVGPGGSGSNFNLQVGQGYALYSDRAGRFVVTGTKVTAKTTVPLVAGWNLVGFPDLSGNPTTGAIGMLTALLGSSGVRYAEIAGYSRGAWGTYAYDDALHGLGTGPRDFNLTSSCGYALFVNTGSSVAL
jgi:subtilase family serine protease